MKKILFIIITTIFCLSVYEGDAQTTASLTHKSGSIGITRYTLGGGFYNYNLQQGSDILVGSDGSGYTGRGQLVFNLAQIPTNAQITAVKLKLATRSGTGTVNIYISGQEVSTANSIFWDDLGNNSNRLGSVSYTGSMDVTSTELTNYIKNSLGSRVAYMHMVHASENFSYISFNSSNIRLEVTYTEPSVTEKVTITGPTSIAEGSTGVFTATYTGPNTPSTYTWTVTSNLSIVSGQNTRQLTVRGASAGIGTVSVRAGNVQHSFQTNVTSSTVNVNNQTITTNRDFTGKIINITNSTVSNNAVVNFTATDRVTINPNTRFQQGTTVRIRATGATTRSAEVDFNEDILLLPQAYPEININKPVLYPNPVKDNLNVRLGNSAEHIRHLEIYNMAGVLIEKRQATQQTETFNLNSQPAGFYILRVVYKDGKSESHKFIVNK